MIDLMTVKLLNFCDYLVTVLSNDPGNKLINEKCATAPGRIELMAGFGIPAEHETDPGYILAHYDAPDVGTQVLVDQLVNIVGLGIVGSGLPDQSQVPATTPDWAYTNIFSFLAKVLQYPALFEELMKNPNDVSKYGLTNSFGEQAAVTNLFTESNATSFYGQVSDREKQLQTSMNEIVNSFWTKFHFSC